MDASLARPPAGYRLCLVYSLCTTGQGPTPVPPEQPALVLQALGDWAHASEHAEEGVEEPASMLLYVLDQK